MKQLTENQLDKINKHLSKMTEAQQDLYLQKLEEGGNLIQNIIAKFGSAKNNLAKLQKQKTQISAQLSKMIATINASQVQGVSSEDKQKDIQALTALKQKVDSINLNIQAPEDAPVTTNADKGAPAANGQQTQK